MKNLFYDRFVSGGFEFTSVKTRYIRAMICIAAALLIRALFGQELLLAPYLPAYLAVLAACRFWGLGPSVLAAVIGAVGCTLIPPRVAPGRLAVFLAVCAVAVWIIENFRRARAEAEHHARVAADRLAQLEIESEHLAREERLSAQLRSIVESSEDAIISKNLDGVIQSWNRGAETVFGYTTAEAIGANIRILLAPDRIHEESEILERIRGGARIKHFETVRLRKDGKPIHVSLTVSPIRGSDGAITGVSHIARDITERKEFEEQLRQTQKLESLGVLAGGIAHDFNNLLTGIMGNASLAQAELDRPDQARQRLDEVLQASERAALLIRQMLTYAGKGRFHLERLDLSTQVREIVPLVGASISKLVEVRLRLADGLPPVEADRSQIQQLIMNLIINGAEAIGDRPGSVTISTAHRSSDSEDLIVLEVADNGSGMTAEVKARVFDPFFTTKFTGRGLGLSAVMGIIRSHQGSISVESEPGKGAVFTVLLPAASGEVAAVKLPTETELRGFGHILVVDDEELVRNMARSTLDRYGYTVEVASDGNDAVEKFGARPGAFAAVLLDLTMPNLNGEDALRSIRRIHPHIPVVLSSGFTESEALKRFVDLGLSGFLQKPYTAGALARKMKQALNGPSAHLDKPSPT